jgi:hypothetical protein
VSRVPPPLLSLDGELVGAPVGLVGSNSVVVSGRIDSVVIISVVVPTIAIVVVWVATTWVVARWVPFWVVLMAEVITALVVTKLVTSKVVVKTIVVVLSVVLIDPERFETVLRGETVEFEGKAPLPTTAL